MKREFLSVAIALALAVPVRAQVLVTREVQTDGIQGFGAFTKELKTWIAGDSHRDEEHVLGKASLMQKMMGTESATITRLDKKVQWRLNPQKKTYEAYPLAPSQDKTRAAPETEGSEADTSTPEKPAMKITRAEFTVKPLGQKKTLSGYPCENYQMTVLLEMEELESHSRTEMKMITTLWTAPETGNLMVLKKEETDYAKAYLAVLGVTDSSQDAMKLLGTSMVAGLAGTGEKELSQALAKAPQEMKKIKGYPIVTRVEWYAGDAGDQPVFAMATELKSISTGPISPDVFQVPPGYKKVN